MTATSLEAFQHEILRNWATHFGCSPATVQQVGAALLPADKYAGQRLIALWHIGAHTFVEHDPAYTQVLERVVAGLPAGAALTGDTLKQSWGADALAAHDLGLAHYLYPPDLPPYTPPAPFVLRRLTLADAGAMAALHATNSPEDVDEGYVEVFHEIAFGCFAGDQLVAAGQRLPAHRFPGYRRPHSSRIPPPGAGEDDRGRALRLVQPAGLDRSVPLQRDQRQLAGRCPSLELPALLPV